MKEEKEILNRSINKGEKVPGRVFPKRVSEKEYVGGYYLPKQDLHQILETLFKLKLKSKDEEGNAGYLVAKKQKHPNLFWLVDSIEARRDLRVLIPLLDYLSQLQKMPDNMCDLNKFEDAMALDPKQIRPAVKKAILERITYIDTDGKEKPLVQFYVEKKLHNDKDVYGVCVPRTAKGQKALLELAGFKIQTYETQNIFTERQRIIIEKRYKGLTLDDVGKLFNVNKERIRQIEAKAFRKLRMRFKNQDKSEPEEHSSTDKNALYMKDSEGDFIITQTAFNQGYLKCPSHHGSLSKSKQKIIKFDRESRE